jgi:hypothetical protein
MMPYETYLNGRRSALFHVQVELKKVPDELPEKGYVFVEANVGRVFRTNGQLKIGDPVRFDVNVIHKNAPRHPGGAWYIDSDALACARFMEVFLNGTPPECPVALWQTRIIDAFSDLPQMELYQANSYSLYRAPWIWRVKAKLKIL